MKDTSQRIVGLTSLRDQREALVLKKTVLNKKNMVLTSLDFLSYRMPYAMVDNDIFM
uniref:Uncharacterized protein n=1 Tax=Octopus bimaculoides TaxID=37653 RepID=A0A0L8FUS2_OCTBM